ncbi:MAG: hypothetical protein MK188_08205 [Gammaproteobacteria bacterium]|nr:hypothetical protein [Gammaproteobacteria bacterium]
MHDITCRGDTATLLAMIVTLNKTLVSASASASALLVVVVLFRISAQICEHNKEATIEF